MKDKDAPSTKVERVAARTNNLAPPRYGMIGDSEPMRKIFATIPKFASSDAPVLINGESGTGKELIARAIHFNSARAKGPFLALSCAAIPHSLIQSELFGHEKGAFTGAYRKKIGKFEAAAGGTILLDEIGDLPIEVQANLLRCLETRTINHVGGDGETCIDVRVIAATHIDLEAASKAGEFREDLFYRLNVLGITAPPLRARCGDIKLLADHYFEYFTDAASRRRIVGFSDDARRAMRLWHWPGNVRELRNRVQKAIALCDEGPLTRQDLGLERRAVPRAAMTLNEARKEAERRAIMTALDCASDNVTLAADILGVSRMTLYRLLKKHGIEHSDDDTGTQDVAAPEG